MIEIVLVSDNKFEVQTREDPEPVANQVRIRVKASGINFADIMARKGMYPDRPSTPCVVGYEVSGTIDKVGPDADSSLVGKDVVSLTKFKGYADTVITEQHHCVIKPKNLSFVDAASIPVVFLTAWMLIYVQGGLRQGQTILIQNAGGAVGLAAIDIAKHIGAISIGTASGRKHEFLKKRGLNYAIDYRTEDVSKRVMELTKNVGVDLIIDPVGDSWQQNYNLLRHGGRIGFFGASTLSDLGGSNIISKLFGLVKFFFSLPRWSPLALMDVNRGVFGLNLARMWNDDRLNAMLQTMVDGHKEGWVRPHVDKVFAFDQVMDAHMYIENRQNIGKVILVPTKNDIPH
jgi:NADPH:quinone reductase-like Zn-dependent oxidoreductase